MFLLGLRNYGEQYIHTVHNLGEEFIIQTNRILNNIFYFSIVDQKHEDAELYERKTYKFKNSSNLNTLMLKGPINSSGEILTKCSNLINEIQSSSLIIIYDDILLPTACIKVCKVKLQTKHNGVLGIISNKIAKDLYTIRIGATKPIDITTNNFVLSKLNIDEYRNQIYQFIIHMFDAIIDNVNTINIDDLVKHLQTYKA